MGFRRAAKKDGNQTQIVTELRQLGYRVDIVSQLKKLYDLVVTGRIYGTDEIRTLRVELKVEKGRLTDDEKEYHEADPYPETLLIAKSTEDVLEWFSTKNNSKRGAGISVNVDAAKKDTTRTTP
jgi:hypothetical protein